MAVVTKGQQSSYWQGADIYDSLKALAGDLDIPIWTASQSNKTGNETQIIQGHQIAQSYAKVMVADFVMSISRRAQDKQTGTARIHIVKNRMGPDGLTYQARTNMATGHMQLFENNTIQSLNVKKGSSASQKQSIQRQIIKKVQQQKLQQKYEQQ